MSIAETTSKIDYLIVGQGLAGSAIAAQLLMRKKKIVVIDWPAGNNSSSVAAGLFNPLTGKKMVRTWMAEILFPYMESYYNRIEKITGKKILNPMTIYRPFLSAEEQNERMAASTDPSGSLFIEKIVTQPNFSGTIRNPFGGLFLNKGGYIDTNGYLNSVRNWLEKENSYMEEESQHGDLMVNNEEVRYRNISASAVIFCEGTHVLKNKLFKWLPITPLKGETLTIRAALIPETIVNRGVYIVPGEVADTWRVGATYEYGAFEPGITEKGRKELEEKLRELLVVPFQVIDHQWGARPTTLDQKPIIGKHPEWARAIIFNGFGTKAVSLTPYFSEVLVNWLENGGNLNKDVDINRYKSVYWRSPE